MLELPEQTAVLPVIAPGVAGMPLATVTANVCAAEAPQVLAAATETFPLALAVAVIELVVDVPVQPPGIIQL